MNEQKGTFLANYVTLFLDVLGQKQLISRLIKVPEQQSEVEEVIALLKETAGFIRMMRELFDLFYHSAAQLSPLGKQQSEEIQHFLSQVHDVNIIKSYFSDSFIFSVCLMERHDNPVPLSGLYNTIYGACFTQFATLALGKPLRGGIDIGLSIEIKENEIYGRSLSSAYALERDQAEYPRIVVGKALYETLTEALGDERTDPYGKINKYLAQECLNLMFIDSDNKIALDYLSPHIREHIPHKPKELANLINFNKIIEFAERSLTQFASDSKLKPRYEALLQYVKSRAEIWV